MRLLAWLLNPLLKRWSLMLCITETVQGQRWDYDHNRWVEIEPVPPHWAIVEIAGL